ncbi:MAG: hypothetical protein IT419_00730 [Planctomycetes bacterium]|nr:hypothetical protein [Planctomycetota bacterium]
MPELKLNIAANSLISKGNELACQVVITVDGRLIRVDRLRLDSPRSRSDLAKRLQTEFGIAYEETARQLDELSLEAVKNVQAARRAAIDNKSLPRLSQLADEWLAGLGPKHHRNGKAIYLESAGREIPISNLWRHLPDDAVDAVVDTQEGREISGDGQKPPHQKLLSLMREAVTMAGERLIRTLTEIEVSETEDPTADPDELVERLILFLVKPRLMRSEDGVCHSSTFQAWAETVAADGRWHQCYSYPMFAQRDSGSGSLIVAVMGAFLREELNYRSAKRLVNDLRHSGLLDKADHVLGTNGKHTRAWLLSEKVGQAMSGESNGDQAVS